MCLSCMHVCWGVCPIACLVPALSAKLNGRGVRTSSASSYLFAMEGLLSSPPCTFACSVDMEAYQGALMSRGDGSHTQPSLTCQHITLLLLLLLLSLERCSGRLACNRAPQIVHLGHLYARVQAAGRRKEPGQNKCKLLCIQAADRQEESRCRRELACNRAPQVVHLSTLGTRVYA